MTVNFFEEAKEQSLVKATIVEKYFYAWANVITSTQIKTPWNKTDRIAYIDLFAGPGRYKDGTTSTPLRVLQKAIADDVFRDRLVCLFNDKDETHTQDLQEAINALPGVSSLKHTPVVQNKEVGTEIVKMFEQMKLVPTLFFVDPWGYKGLSLRLINSVLKDWGCDCIFFFNYTRINMGIPNPMIRPHMEALFGSDRVDAICAKIDKVSSPADRELIIIEELCTALKELGGKFTLPFRFKKNGKRTSHHLIFVSKNFLGYEIMKGIMAKESSTQNEGVASFEYNPMSDALSRQGLLFKLSQPISDLSKELLNTFSGQTLTMNEVYRQHNVDTPYISSNYKSALLKLEEDGKISTFSAKKRRKGTFADHISVTFP